MRVAHIVTLVSESGDFGGPLSVARGQCVELARRGHDVTLFAGWDGKGSIRAPAVDVQLRRAHRLPGGSKFAGLVAPGLLRALRPAVSGFDIVQVHLARDLVTLPGAAAALHAGVPVVTQTHGMIVPDHRVVVRAIDTVSTRPMLRRATVTTYLTEQECDALVAVGARPETLTPLRNGIEVSAAAGSPVDQATDDPTIAFCARLHPRKRVMAFARMAAELCRRGVEARFVVHGPDEGDLRELRAFISTNSLGARLAYEGALRPDDVRSTLREAAVYVLPSEREPFPMTLLEAMAEGTPAVVSDGCMISSELLGPGFVVTDGSPHALADGVQTMLGRIAGNQRPGDSARRVALQHFGIGRVVDELEQIYARARSAHSGD